MAWFCGKTCLAKQWQTGGVFEIIFKPVLQWHLVLLVKEKIHTSPLKDCSDYTPRNMVIQRTVMSVHSKHVNIRDIHLDNPVTISIEMPRHPSKTALRVLTFEVELLLNDLSPCSRSDD